MYRVDKDINSFTGNPIYCPNCGVFIVDFGFMYYCPAGCTEENKTKQKIVNKRIFENTGNKSDNK